jgi:class 3 adenylate cyclase
MMNEVSLNPEELAHSVSEDIISGRLSVLDSSDALLVAKQYVKLKKGFNRILKISDRNEISLQKISALQKSEKEKFELLSNQVARYIPRQVFETIYSGENATEVATRRKHLTIIFSDVCGFTAISEALQPEVLTKYLNQYFSELSKIANQFGATIDKYIGDAMMMFFGDPTTRGNAEDAKQAILMSMAMQKRLVELREQWAQEGFSHEFIARIGINSGYCNVGNFGSDNLLSYTTIGGEVNLAARIESHCHPGGIFISANTALLVDKVFELEEQESIKLKGISQPVKTFSVKGLLPPDDAAMLRKTITLGNDQTISIDLASMNLQDRQKLSVELRAIIQQVEDISGLIPEEGNS